MSEHPAEKDCTETLRCIYCQRAISWPVLKIWPSRCLDCGRWPGAYTSVISPARGDDG